MPDGHLSSRRDSSRPCPSVNPAAALMNLLMAADAKALQVAFVMGAAICQGQNMMNQLCCFVLTVALAQLTKWMTTDVPVPNPSPPLIVAFMMVVATGKFLVVPFHHLAMVFAVAALMVSQFWTAAVSAWSLWFHWHGLHLDSRH